MIDFLTDDVSSLFVIEKLSEKNLNQTFVIDEEFSEYKDFLYLDALNYQSLFISQTYLLLEKETRTIIAYISQASDTICMKAFNVNTSFMACRLVSVDADVEHNPNVLEFYSKNGFFPLKNSVYKKKFPNRTKTVGMWKDCFL